MHGLFKEQCRAFASQYTITDFSHLEISGNGLINALELTSSIELLDEVSKVAIFHYSASGRCGPWGQRVNIGPF